MTASRGMSKDEMRALLAEQMAKYRALSHAQLAEHIEPDWRKRTHLEVEDETPPA